MELVEQYLNFETGRLAEKRPGFQRLIEDGMERLVCVLIFHISHLPQHDH